MTGLNKLLKAMHGGQLPPKDSWLVLVRHEDGAFSAHIWLVSSPVRLGRMPGGCAAGCATGCAACCRCASVAALPSSAWLDVTIFAGSAGCPCLRKPCRD